MKIVGQLVLAPGLSFIPVGDLPETVRDRLNGSGYAVTRPTGRVSSTLLDDDATQLLREFAAPTTIVEAVLRFSRRRTLDPEQVLDASYPVLRRCLDNGFLIEAGSPGSAGPTTAFAIGERVAGGIVVRCVHALEDGEIYQLSMEGGGLAALKVIRADRSAGLRTAFRREAAALLRLDGTAAPRLLATGETDGRPWLLLEWCDGVPILAAAAASRRSADGARSTLAMVVRLARAYATMHARLVLHGDVHPGNLLVAADGAIRILDFGLATGHGVGLAERAPRGAVPGYLDPQYADALQEGREPPEISEADEQYALAAIGYELLTGRGYLDFNIEEAELRRQIVEDPPLPFTQVGRATWPDVETVLRTALAKDPAHRWSSMAAFADRLSGAVPAARSYGGAAGVLDRLLHDVLAAARPGGSWFVDGSPTEPLVSVAYGSAGVALALLHVACSRDDVELAALADKWAERSVARARGDRAFEAQEYELTEAVTGRTTPFHRLSGVHAVRVLISHSLANIEACQVALGEFIAESQPPCEGLDLVLGRGGTLLGAAILAEVLGEGRHVQLARLKTLGSGTLAHLWRELDAQPPIAEGTRLRHLGVAHGWAGLLVATLRWCAATDTAVPSGVIDRLDQLAAMAQPVGLGLRWPWTNDTAATMPGWCNGSAGFVHLWTAAYVADHDQRWLDLAERAAWHAYLTPGIPQLCCGLAGQSYALLELYRHTAERRWLGAATELAVRAATEAGGAVGMVSGSLHKGELGVALLACDLARPEMAAMPFFGRIA